MVIRNVDLPLAEIADICRRFAVEELLVFGSALRDDFGSASDVDFLVVFKNNDAGPWLDKFTDLEEELSRLLGRRADVVDKHGIEQSENYIRRKHILDSAQIVYVAG